MLGIAAFRGRCQPEIVEVDDPPDPGHGEVLCKTLQVGVCGTDREILESNHPFAPAGSDYLILGHECLARVEQVGPDSELTVGQLVVPVVRRALNPSVVRPDMLAFGEYTERGIVQEHGFTTPLFVDRVEHLFPASPTIASTAILTEPLSVAEKGANEALAVQRGRLGEGAWRSESPRVLVTGMGPIAFSAVMACCCRGWPVTMYGRDKPDSFRAELAQEFGARYRPSTAFESEPPDVEVDGYDLVLECTGSDEVMVRVSHWLASRGVMAWLGSSRAPAPKSHNLDLVMRNGVLRNHIHLGSVNAAPRDFRDALEHLEQLDGTHSRQVALLLTDRVAPAESLWHYEHRRPQGIKTVLTYE